MNIIKGVKMIYSIVTMIIKEGKMNEFLAECRKIRPLVLAEQGCLMYDYTQEVDYGSDQQEPVNRNRITLYEKWANKEALDLHSEMPYMAEFAKKVAPMRDSVIIRTGIEAF
jgi:quinol monooxygenase YgiN